MSNNQKKSVILAEIYERFAAEKNKVIMTCLLIGLMSFMWFKVLTGKKQMPAEANASQNSNIQAKPLKLNYITLPFVQGRNDVISRDIFSNDRTAYDSQSQNDGSSVISDTGEKDIQLAGEMLKLDAIMSGTNPEAFISDRLVKVSEKLIVEKNGKNYEFTVLNISKSKVVLKCSQTVVELSLTDNSAQN